MFLVETVCLKRYYQVRMEKDIDIYLYIVSDSLRSSSRTFDILDVIRFGLININYII